jgi:hypothetical protein
VGALVLGVAGVGLRAVGRGLGAAGSGVGTPGRGLGALGHGLGASLSASGNDNGLISGNSNGLVSVSSELNVTIVHHCAACHVQGNEGNVNPAGSASRRAALAKL